MTRKTIGLETMASNLQKEHLKLRQQENTQEATK